MKRGKRPELIWGLGLSDQERQSIEQAVGPGFFLRNFPEGKLPWATEMAEKEKPTVAWIPARVWNKLPNERRSSYEGWEEVPRILIEDETTNQAELEEVLEQGFLTAVRSPLTKNKVQDSLFRAKEISSLYEDIYRMTEEIFLERELLARKTDQLLFLNKLLARASESLDAADILASAREDLKMLLPVRSLQGVFWRPDKEGGLEAEMFLHSRMEEGVQDQWIEFMLESARKISGKTVNEYGMIHVNNVSPDQDRDKDLEPRSGHILAMPLKSGREYFGTLAILCSKPVRLAKDQSQTLTAAVNHLSMALRNALTFREVKTRADRDGLTRIYNRQSFDDRLLEEMSRHQRYHHDLSVLMIDLDHFKDINDEYGHQAGDLALRETSAILHNELRTTDFPARYGGEEFVVILPHTAEEHAWKLAERIRQRIAEKHFRHNGSSFRVTASIGVASLQPGSLEKGQELILKVDQALYAAKANGRNMVVISGKEPATSKEAV